MYVLTEHNGMFQVEMQKNDHLAITRLKERVLYIVVQNIHFVPSDGSEPEPVRMRFQRPAHSFRDYIRSYVQVF